MSRVGHRGAPATRNGEPDADATAEHETTRRQAVGRGIAAGAGALTAATMPALVGVANAFADADGDADVIERAVGLEQSAAFAYTAAANSGKLGAATRVARHFAVQEQEHADALTRALEGLGRSAPAKPTRPRDVAGLGAAIAGGAHDILTFAVEVETMSLKAYYEAHGKLRDASLIATSATIMADEAQHLVVLRQALGRNPSPDAFVTGAAPGRRAKGR